MKYAIKYYRNCPILEEVDEIIIQYDSKDPELINFVQKWQENQRIIIDITSLPTEEVESSLQIFTSAKTAHSIVILCNKNYNYKSFIEADIPFFFKEGVFTFDELVAQNNLGVSDIYIGNELGFYLTSIAEAYPDINIRVIPNIAQTSNINNVGKINDFFIRPEDIEIYEKYVNIIEFFSPLPQQPQLYKIYKSGQWGGKLDDLIQNLNSDIHNMTIMPMFGPSRINCRKKCAFKECDICNHILTAAKEIEKDNLFIVADT